MAISQDRPAQVPPGWTPRIECTFCTVTLHSRSRRPGRLALFRRIELALPLAWGVSGIAYKLTLSTIP